MIVYVIDISGKVIGYDNALCEELYKIVPITLAVHKWDGERYEGRRLPLIRLVPTRYKNTEHIIKRLFKAVESLLNYFWLLIRIFVERPTILHFQWLPFMEFCSVDNYYLAIIKFFRPKQKIVLTVHNVYPHDMSDINKSKYRDRFKIIDKYINRYIVHVDSSKRELIDNFGIEEAKIMVVPHGIFTPNFAPKKKEKRGRHILMYGNNTPYKGTDLLLDALHLIPADIRQGITVTIVGKTSERYFDELSTKAKGLDVKIIPEFMPDQKLYEMIDDADYIALPYRNISQSGVLLLALYFRKPLLISNLPSFKETLKGFTEDMFFESDNAHSLAELIERHLNGKIDVDGQLKVIDGLVDLYSWKKSAQLTKSIYEELVKW